MMSRRGWFTLLSLTILVSVSLTGCLGLVRRPSSSSYIVEGQVTDIYGEGVEGIRLVITGNTSSTVTTDAQGKWRASISGTVEVVPEPVEGYWFVPESTIVTPTQTGADFTMVEDATILEEIVVEAGHSTVVITSSLYNEAPQVILPGGSLPQGTQVKYQVVGGIDLNPDSPVSVLGLPIRLEVSSESVSSLSGGMSQGTVTVRGRLEADAEVDAISIFNGEFWEVFSPTITGGWWELELNVRHVQASDSDSARLYKNLLVALQVYETLELVVEPVRDPVFELYEFREGRWDKEADFRIDGQQSDGVLLFMHGLWSDHTIWDTAASYFSRNYPQFKLYAISYDDYFSLETLGTKFAELLSNGVVEETEINIVAHSMGGLVSRQALQIGGAAEHVNALVTLGTPHQGVPSSIWISLTVNASDRQLLPWPIGWFLRDPDWIDTALSFAIGPAWRDLGESSDFLLGLNSRKGPQLDYYLSGGSNTDYEYAQFTGPIYGSVPNDGLISVSSALLSDHHDMVDFRGVYDHLNHATIYKDDEVFEQIIDLLHAGVGVAAAE